MRSGARRWGRVALLGALLAGGVARADQAPVKGAVVRPAGRDARVDWTRGVAIARGAAAGDLRAPSPEMARHEAERRARTAARARLRELALDLPMADGRKLGKSLGSAARARLDRALDAAIDLDVDHSSDGSVVLSAALPLEAVRGAVAGPSLATDAGPTALVIEAGRHLDRPVLGLTVAAGAERYAGPTIFATRAGAVDTDRLGARPIKSTARKLARGVLELDVDAARVASARASGALVVIILADPAPGKKEKP